MNLLDRHIFKSVLWSCLGAVALFGFVLMLGSAIKDLLGPFLAGQLGLTVMIELLLMLPLTVAGFALPMGVLTGVLLTLGRMSSDSEIVAMRAAGISLWRITRPVLLLGLLGGLTGLYINFDAMPRMKVRYERQLAAAVRANPLSFIVPKTFITQFPNTIIYVGEKQGTTLRDFWLWKLDSERRVTQLVHAESGQFDFDAETSELILTLTLAQAEERDEKAPENFEEPPRVGSFERYGPERLSLQRIFGRDPGLRRKLRWMTYRQLEAELARISAEPIPPDGEKNHALAKMKVKLTVQDKFNTALAVFSFALIGVPLGIRVSRRETSANLGIAVLMALGYYMLTVMVGWLDRHPEYRPDLLLWVPNLIFITLGLWLFARIDRRQS